MKKFRMTPTLEQFKAGLAKQREILTRHGLFDPTERSRGYKKRKIPEREPRLASSVLDDVE